MRAIATSLKRVGLRARYQLLCRHVLYSAGCGALRERFRVDGLVVSVSGTRVTVVAAAGPADGYFMAGMLSAATGLRMITAQSGSDLTLVASLIGLTVGDAVSLFAGCDHSMEQCASRFDNLDNLGGFPFIPGKEPLLWRRHRLIGANHVAADPRLGHHDRPLGAHCQSRYERLRSR